jgi:hypothetical protein
MVWFLSALFFFWSVAWASVFIAATSSWVRGPVADREPTPYADAALVVIAAVNLFGFVAALFHLHGAV